MAMTGFEKMALLRIKKKGDVYPSDPEAAKHEDPKLRLIANLAPLLGLAGGAGLGGAIGKGSGALTGAGIGAILGLLGGGVTEDYRQRKQNKAMAGEGYKTKRGWGFGDKRYWAKGKKK